MIASGAMLEAYDVHFGPPLHIACAKGHVDCVKELLNAGQQDDCSVRKNELVLKTESVEWLCPTFLSMPRPAGCHTSYV